jgi:hypothetical protein
MERILQENNETATLDEPVSVNPPKTVAAPEDKPSPPALAAGDEAPKTEV